jgi:integrase
VSSPTTLLGGRRHDSPHQFLPPGAVEQVLKHCERRSAEGMRNYAILLLLARLGLRAGEVVSLTLDDIDWRSAQLRLHCKGQRSAHVPLIAEVGEALACYLKHGRPRCATRRVFIRGCAPREGFANSSAICCIVERALVRAGVHSTRKGAHLFRHTLATQMLRHGLPSVRSVRCCATGTGHDPHLRQGGSGGVYRC